MQARGIAEAEPALDIDGWDAAAKTAALVNVLMGGVVTPHDVTRVGHPRRHRRRRARRARPQQAHPAGGVGVATGRPGRGPRRTGAARSARIRWRRSADQQNALYLHTDLLGEVGIVQRTGSLTQTAYALLSDLARISQRLKEL